VVKQQQHPVLCSSGLSCRAYSKSVLRYLHSSSAGVSARP
jgi:hypothetical protein